MKSKTVGQIFRSSLVAGGATVIGAYLAYLLLERLRHIVTVKQAQTDLTINAQALPVTSAGGGCGCQASS